MQTILTALTEAPTWTLYLFITLLGLCVGSFINVVAYRTPLMLKKQWRTESADILGIELADSNPSDTTNLSLCSPGSHCPHCQTAIKWYHNIPLFGWLYLNGKCHSCKQRISIQYPLVELISAGLSLLIVVKIGYFYPAVFALIFLWICLALYVIDLKEQILPDRLVFPLMGLGLLCNMNSYFVPLEYAVSGLLIGFMSLWSINAAYKMVKKSDGMGFGDFKLFAALGAWFGPLHLIDIILYASISGVASGIIFYMIHKQSMRFPFGPHLIFGGFLVLLVPFSFFQ